MTMDESTREAIDEGKRILASVVAQLRDAWNPAKRADDGYPPELDSEGWRKKFEASNTEVSVLRIETDRLRAIIDDLRTKLCATSRESDLHQGITLGLRLAVRKEAEKNESALRSIEALREEVRRSALELSEANVKIDRLRQAAIAPRGKRGKREPKES